MPNYLKRYTPQDSAVVFICGCRLTATGNW